MAQLGHVTGGGIQRGRRGLVGNGPMWSPVVGCSGARSGPCLRRPLLLARGPEQHAGMWSLLVWRLFLRWCCPVVWGGLCPGCAAG